MSKNTKASIKKIKMKIGQFSRQMAAQANSNGGYNGNTKDNPKNKSFKDI